MPYAEHLVAMVLAALASGALIVIAHWPKADRPRIDKGGVNDLSRWEQFGGHLKRPPPPAPINRKERK